MSLYFYCPRFSVSAMKLIDTLGATKLRRFDGIDFWDRNKRITLNPGSHLICWGAPLANFDGVRVLNSCELAPNKYQEHQLLSKAGILTIGVIQPNYEGYSPKRYRDSGYIPRTFRHSGNDLLYGVSDNPDYYVHKYQITTEYRIHSFDGRSIRAGKKVPIQGFATVAKEQDWKPNANLVHPWVRIHEGGWRTEYDGFHATPEQRAVAHSAVKALGLTFGAVNIGEGRYGGGSIVIGVDTGPVIEGKTIDSYVRAINRWIKGKGEEEEL